MLYRLILVTVTLLSLTSCAMAPPVAVSAADPVSEVLPMDATGERAEAIEVEPTGSTAPAAEPQSLVSLGTGVFVQPTRTRQGNGHAAEDGVTINFEQANLREFLRVVFDTILHENYLIDPQVQGVVTLHTTRPVEKGVVLSIVETVLQTNGAAMVLDEGIFKIIPLAEAAGVAGPAEVGRNASSRTRGFGIQVVPLRYASAGELRDILADFVPQGSTLRADELRNVLILTGPRYRLDELLATIRTFDVDWLSGMSFGLFRLKYADAATLISEIETIISGDGASRPGVNIRLVPIERLNAVLVISHQPDRIARIQELIEQFDWGMESGSGRRLYVYDLENGKAEDIAAVLQQIFGQLDDNPFEDTGSASLDGVFRNAQTLTRPVSLLGQRDDFAALPDSAGGIFAESRSDVAIIADPNNNAILVMASRQDYRAIEAAIRRLDISPRQVLIEATIAEVTLANTLDHGVRWFLQNGDYELGFNAPVPRQASGDGLAFALFDADDDVRAFFDMLATESSVKFLSTPQVMVLDNQTANIRVGDQIPVTTRSSQSTTNPDAPIVTEVQFRDTGTLLTVTPRINAGGQVTLNISLEVSLPGTEPAVGGGGNVSIAQRTINSSVIVQDGQTVVLGGLILETTSKGRSGVPVLMNIPLLGKLFSSTSEDVFRTELIVTMTVRVIENQHAMRRVTEELRMRMKKATEYETLVKAQGSK